MTDTSVARTQQRSLINTQAWESVLTPLTSALGLFLQKIQLQVWEGLLSPEEVPLAVLLPREETEAQPLQVFIWREEAQAF